MSRWAALAAGAGGADEFPDCVAIPAPELTGSGCGDFTGLPDTWQTGQTFTITITTPSPATASCGSFNHFLLGELALSDALLDGVAVSAHDVGFSGGIAIPAGTHKLKATAGHQTRSGCFIGVAELSGSGSAAWISHRYFRVPP